MNFFKILFTILFLVIILVGIGLAYFVKTFDANHYKEKIISLVNKQTGRDLTIDGDLKLSIYPDIAIEMGNTSLSNAKGFSGNKFATIGSAQVSVEVLPLLKKTIKVDEVRLHDLKLNLHRKADGTTNWADLAQSKDSTTQTPQKEKPANEVVTEMLDNLSVAGISLKNADIHWRDDQSGQDIRLAPVHLKTGTFKPGKPLPVDLSLVMKQQNPATTITAEGSTTVTLSDNNQHFSLANLKLHSTVTGAQIPNGNLLADLSGNISGSPEKITIPDLNLQILLDGDLIPEGKVEADINGHVIFDVKAQLATISGLKLDTNVNGKPLEGGNLHALITGDTSFDLAGQKLSIPNLILDASVTGGFVKEGKAHSKVSGDLAVDIAKSHIKMPKISMNTQVEGGLVPGGSLSQQAQGNIDINWASKQGGINLSNLLVKLANLELTGSQVQIQPLAEKPNVSGQFKTNTFNLKHVLNTLGVNAPVTSNPNALSQLQAQFTLKADTENADLKSLKVKLDKTSITGSLGVSHFASPSIRPELSIDSINVDDYLAPSTESKATSTQASSSASSDNAELLPLDTLRSLNIDGGVKIGSMVINQLKLSQVNTRIKAKQGLIIVDPATASLYKGKYKGRITLDAKQATPTMKMRHELVGLRSEGLLFDLFQDKYISGDTKLITELSSRGNTLDVLLRNLNGTTSIGFNDGTIRDSNLAEKVSLAVKVFEKTNIEGDKSVVTFTGLSGDWKTTNGVFKTDNLSMLSPYFNISGEGTADVAKQELDMRLRIGPNSDVKGKSVFAPLHIYGSFSDLKFKLDLKDLIKSLAQADLDKLKQDAKDKLAAKKLELENKFKAEKAAKEQELKQKLQDAKANALKKVEDSAKNKLGDKLGDKLKDSLGGSSNSNDSKKNVEDEVKDKLKDKLKSMF